MTFVDGLFIGILGSQMLIQICMMVTDNKAWREQLARLEADPETYMRAYKIELKVEFDDEEKYAMCEEMVRRLARRALTNATLLMDERHPQVAFVTNDLFMGTEELSMISPEENEDG